MTQNTDTIRIVFAGTPEFAAQSLQAILDSQTKLNAEIVAVYTQPDRKSGRGQKVTASAVKQLAVQHNIPVEQPLTFKKSSEDGMQARLTLQKYNADIMVVAAYGLILPVGVLETPRLGCINIHASLLPRWRGAAPIHRAILAGDAQTGITIMQMDKGLDTGDMLYKSNCIISTTDTSSSLHDKLALQGGQDIVTVLSDIEHYQSNATPQDNSKANYAEKLIKSEGDINWNQSAVQIDAHIRGLQPWPVAYTQLAEKTVRIHQASILENETTGTAGQIIEITKTGVVVQCALGTIQLTSLQWAGGKALNAEQIYSSQKLQIHELFSAQADTTNE